MSLFGPSIFGGFGFESFGGFGGYANVALTQLPADPPTLPDKVAPIDATDRSMLPVSPFGFGLNGYNNLVSGAFPGYDPAPPSSMLLYWLMRKYSAINLAFTVVTAPLTASTRKMEIQDDRGQPELAIRMLDRANLQLLPMLEKALGPSLECLHFGNWLQEIIWGRVGADTVPLDFNSVLPMEAQLFCDPQRKFAGFQIGDQFRDKRYGFLCVNQPHIHPVLGYARNENAKADWWRALNSNMSGDAAERKASGIQMMFGMPMGADFTDGRPAAEFPNGTPICGDDWIRATLNNARMGGAFAVPITPFLKKDIIMKPELANIPAVKVDHFDWGNMGPFILALCDRLDKSDRNMVRAWNRPERESTEGKHGTKAESQGQTEAIGVRDCESVHAMVCRQWDEQVGAFWRLTNYGPNAPILRTKPSPLADEQQKFLQEVAITLASDRNTGPITQSYMNIPKLLGEVEIPMVSQEQAVENQKQQAALVQQSNKVGSHPGNTSDGNTQPPRRQVSRKGVTKELAGVNGRN